MPISLLLLGPTVWFGGLPDKIYVIFIGLFIMGFSAAMMYVLMIPEMFAALKDQLSEEWTKESP
jgi:hypothetical protein